MRSSILMVASVLSMVSAYETISGTCDACSRNDGTRTKLTSLTLRYTGSNTGGSNNHQDSRYFGFSGNPADVPGGATTITARNRIGVYGVYTVRPGESFTVTASRFEAESYFEFKPSGARVYFHTSCTVPLRVGDQFGSVQVVCFSNDYGDSCTSQCGAYEKPCVDEYEQCDNTCEVCTSNYLPSQLSLTYTGGPASVTNNAAGQIYGSSVTSYDASISCTGSRGTVGGGRVSKGQAITLSNLRKAGSEIICKINGNAQTVKIIISCKKQIAIGDRFGALELTGFVTQSVYGRQTRSSSDPRVCPVCELCPEKAILEVPEDITLDCDGARNNHLKLQMWIDAARCYSDKGRKFKVKNTPPLLDGTSTCAVSTEVTWTCSDDRGNVQKKSSTFSVVDRTAPVVIVKPMNGRSECNAKDIYSVPTEELNAWLANHGGMRAKDDCQDETPCSGDAFYIGASNWSGAPYQNGGNYVPPNIQPYFDSNDGGMPYFKQGSHGEGDRTNTGGGSYACAYCPTSASPCCSNGVTYQTPCHAHCAGVTEFYPGSCGSQVEYDSGVVTSYDNDNCACTAQHAPVCSANGKRTYSNPCYARCAGDFDFYNGACDTEIPYSDEPVTGCAHCSAYSQTVCGNNGRQYNSPCHAACAGIYNFHFGECTVYAPDQNCGNELTWTHTDPVFGPCSGYPGQNNYPQQGQGAPLQCANVKFTATDTCGNSVSEWATFEIYDSTPPKIRGGEDFVWSCDEDCSGYGQWEADAQRFLNDWIACNGGLTATDCSPQVAWTSSSLPYGKLCGSSGEITFTATDPFGNSASKTLYYSFPKAERETCHICGQKEYGQNVRASLLELTVVYENSNPAPVNVRVYDLNGQRGLEPGSFVNVVPGKEFRSFVGINYRKGSKGGYHSGGSSNKFPTNTVFHFSNGGKVTIHTSCSQPLYLGQSFSLGYGGSIRIVGFRTDRSDSDSCPGAGYGDCQYPAVCGQPAPPYATAPPTKPPTEPPCQRYVRDVCPYDEKDLQQLIFKYVSTNRLSNGQNGKAKVYGDTTGNHVTIACDGGSQQAVSLNGIYTLDFYDRPDSDTWCRIIGPRGMQKVLIHTSCSKDLETEDQFGHLLLVGFRWADGTYVNNDNCDQINQPVTEYQNWQNGGVDDPDYVPPSYAPPTFPPNLPPSYVPPTQTIIQILSAENKFSTLLELLVSTSLLSALDGDGPFTLLAPTNAAFNAMGSALHALKQNPGQLASVLLFHVVSGNHPSHTFSNRQTLVSFNGQIQVSKTGAGAISFSSPASPVPAALVKPDLTAVNGVVHGINAVLMPFLEYVTTAPPTMPYVATTVPYVPTDGGACTQVQACASNGRLTSLTFKYVGYNGVNHQQMPWGKGYVNDMKNPYRSKVAVKLNSYKKAKYDATRKGWKFKVGLNEEFTIRGDPSNGYKLLGTLSLRVGGAKIKISTNCGAHIAVGDKFGVIVVTGWSNTNDEECYVSSQESEGQASSDGGESSSLSGSSVAGIVVGIVAVAAVALVVVVKTQKHKW